MNNDLINELNNKIDAQDKIINNQVLEIARLNKLLNCKERLTKIMPPDTEFIILSKSDYERQETDIEEIALELRDKIEKAIEYINKRMVHEGEYWIRKAYHFRNTEYGKDLLEILGGKE